MMIHRFRTELVVVSHHVLGVSANHNFAGVLLILLNVVEVQRFHRHEEFEPRVLRRESHIRLLEFFLGAAGASSLPPEPIWVRQNRLEAPGLSQPGCQEHGD